MGLPEYTVYLSTCDSASLFSINFCDELHWRHTFVKYETQAKTNIPISPSPSIQSVQLSGKVDYSSSNSKQW